MFNLCDTVFRIQTNVLQNLHICISVPLRTPLDGYFWIEMEKFPSIWFYFHNNYSPLKPYFEKLKQYKML